jgi:hypothetical protein
VNANPHLERREGWTFEGFKSHLRRVRKDAPRRVPYQHDDDSLSSKKMKDSTHEAHEEVARRLLLRSMDVRNGQPHCLTTYDAQVARARSEVHDGNAVVVLHHGTGRGRDDCDALAARGFFRQVFGTDEAIHGGQEVKHKYLDRCDNAYDMVLWVTQQMGCLASMDDMAVDVYGESEHFFRMNAWSDKDLWLDGDRFLRYLAKYLKANPPAMPMVCVLGRPLDIPANLAHSIRALQRSEAFFPVMYMDSSTANTSSDLGKLAHFTDLFDTVPIFMDSF